MKTSPLRDAWAEARARASSLVGLAGFGVAELRDGDGRLVLAVPFANKITDVGDTYYAVAGIRTSAAAGAPSVYPTGMKLGTGTTAINKAAGTGMALAAYITGSKALWDSSYPQTSALGVNLGTNAIYKVTWPAGTATNGAISEVVIVNDAATDATSTAANTYSRALIGPINKTGTDALAITWNHLFLGA
jgi:hypothetical protein